MNTLKIFVIAVSLTWGPISFSADWNTSSVMLLKGDNFMVGPDKSRTEMTYENAAGYKYGDTFFFVDITSPAQSKDDERTSEMYGEWSPRFSLGKPLGWVTGDGILKDILFSNTFEFGNNNLGQSRTNLHGVAFDFNLAPFAFFQWNIYIRDNLDVPGTTTQSTFSYLLPFDFTDRWKFIYAAYIDIVHGDEGEKDGVFVEAHSHSGQQFKLDLGNFYGAQGMIYTGIEYQVWKAKFGIKDGEEEYNVKYFLQWQF